MSTAASAPRCPLCSTVRAPGDRYCENDGYDFDAGALPGSRRSWVAVVSADLDHFRQVGPGPLEFPADPPTRTVPLRGDEIRIGRRSRSLGVVPDIDLSVPPEDPGVSHVHARLAREPDGSYAIVDLGSTNGTTMNTDPNPIPPHTAITVADGDRIHIGAWTTITFRALSVADLSEWSGAPA